MTGGLACPVALPFAIRNASDSSLLILATLKLERLHDLRRNGRVGAISGLYEQEFFDWVAR